MTAPLFVNWDRRCRRGAAVLFGLGLLGVFLLPPDFLIGSEQGDLARQFLAWRAFAAQSLRAGHWPLWNPYTYAGEPFLAGFQSAVFYPPNLVFLILPLCRAVNLSLLIHGFILAGGMVRWGRQRGLHPIAAALGGLVIVCSGPVFPQVYAGHLSNLCTLAWAPWLFAGLEQWDRRGERQGLLIAAGAVAGQILAGHVQYVFGVAVAAAVHGAGSAATGGRAAPRRVGLGLVAAYGFGAALAAAQLLPGLAAAAEGVRHGGLDAVLAGQFSLPPENLLTAAVPGFFGDPTEHLYWGRCYPWEMSLFVGVSGCFLIAIAAFDFASRRGARWDLGIAAVLLLLALGRHTPLFHLLYAFGPGFSHFRGWSKFTFPAMLFLVLTLGRGADAILRHRRPARFLATAGIASGIVALLGGIALESQPSLVRPWLARVRASGESYLPIATFTDPVTIQAVGAHAGRSLAVAGLLAVLCGGLLGRTRAHPRVGCGLLLLLPLELAAFAASQFDYFSESDAVRPAAAAFIASHPGDYRIENLAGSNNGFLLGAADLGGNDPAVIQRYAQFIAFTQGADPDHANQIMPFASWPPIYALLRLRYVFTDADGAFKVTEVPGAMNRAQLVSQYRVLPDRKALFAALAAPGFDPRKTVLLEGEPSPRPAGSAAGRVQWFAQSADAFTVEADVSAPALLLITDPYSRDWRARSLPGSSQESYQILPADYVVRATPLAAGHHRIQFYYEPSGLPWGLGISGAAWAAFAWLCSRRSSPELAGVIR
jgi:hypothetical protein